MHDTPPQTSTLARLAPSPSNHGAPPQHRNRHQRRTDATIARRNLSPPDPLLCRTKETCRLLSIGMTTLYEMLKSGELKSTVVGGRRLIYYQSILEVAGLADQDAE